jgi:hypothetical protein
VMKEIADLHDSRHIKIKEKNQQLRAEICRLQRMLVTSQEDTSILINQTSRMESMVTQTSTAQFEKIE